MIDHGANVKSTGERTQSYDLEVLGPDNAFLKEVGLAPGKYEVKSLWRKNERCQFDRRFKVGSRGERIYGRRDSEIKAFAGALEREIDGVIDHSLDPIVSATPGSVTKFVEETHEFIDAALERRHSKKFMERLARLARASYLIPNLRIHALNVTSGNVQGLDIVRGFDNIKGIFVVAGPIYTLVSQSEMQGFLAFDSASSEGPKLRWQGTIPSEAVIQSSRNNVRKEKGNKK